MLPNYPIVTSVLNLAVSLPALELPQRSRRRPDLRLRNKVSTTDETESGQNVHDAARVNNVLFSISIFVGRE